MEDARSHAETQTALRGIRFIVFTIIINMIMIIINMIMIIMNMILIITLTSLATALRGNQVETTTSSSQLSVATISR